MKILLISFLILLSSYTYGQTVPINSYYIPSFVESKDSGVMVELLKEIERKSGIDFDLTLKPTIRVQKDFQQGFIHGYFPELKEFLPSTRYCISTPFMQKKVFAVVRKGEATITAISQLEGKRVGAVSGYSYGNGIINNPEIDLIRVSNDEINVKKLLTKRIDVIAGDQASTIAALNNLNAHDKVDFDIGQPLDILDVFFVFKDTKEGRAHCQAVSKAIEQLKKEGYISKHFGN